MRESVHVSVPCSHCNSPADLVPVARGTPECIRFSTSFHCRVCGDAYEADAKLVPDDVRPLFYKEHGLWRLVVLGVGPDKTRAMRGLRDRLGLSPANIGTLLREAPAEVARGTGVEMDVLGEALASAGVLVEAERC